MLVNAGSIPAIGLGFLIEIRILIVKLNMPQ